LHIFYLLFDCVISFKHMRILKLTLDNFFTLLFFLKKKYLDGCLVCSFSPFSLLWLVFINKQFLLLNFFFFLALCPCATKRRKILFFGRIHFCPKIAKGGVSWILVLGLQYSSLHIMRSTFMVVYFMHVPLI
jgi:hypothetical protein